MIAYHLRMLFDAQIEWCFDILYLALIYAIEKLCKATNQMVNKLLNCSQ